MTTLSSINRESRLYVLKFTGGYSCLGFDVCHERTRRAADWLKRPDLAPPPRRGTKKAYAAYRAAYDAVLDFCREHGVKAPIELEPRLIGLEGKRVEVRSEDGSIERFTVARSMGPVQIHLAIKRRDSTGGCAVHLRESDTIRVL